MSIKQLNAAVQRVIKIKTENCEKAPKKQKVY